jgi:hypothetical protein
MCRAVKLLFADALEMGAGLSGEGEALGGENSGW